MGDDIEYTIPLSTIYEGGSGPHVLIRNDITGSKMYVALDRDGEGRWDEFVPLTESEVEELMHVCMAYLNRRNTGRLGSSRTGISFEDYVDE